MTLLNSLELHAAKFSKARFIEKNGLAGRGGATRLQHYRALNCELEVFDESGEPIGFIPWGISVSQTASHNNALIRFFRSIGVFFDPTEFDPEKDLEGMEVNISVNNVCDNHWGIRTVVDKFFPAPLTNTKETP